MTHKIMSYELVTNIGLVVGALCSGVWGYHLYLSGQRIKEPPMRWSWTPILGFALEIGDRPIELFKESANMLGEIFGMVVGGNRLFIITDPHSYNIILKPNKDLSWEEFHNQIMNNFFGISTSTTLSHVVDDDQMRSLYAKQLFGDAGLHHLTTRMQQQLVEMIANVKDGKFQMFEFLSEFIFEASVVSLFNKETAKQPGLLKAYQQFDKALPLACAGVDVAYLKNVRDSRALLTTTCARNRLDLSDFINKRWEYFDGLTSQAKMSPADSAPFQMAMLWASVGNTIPTTFWVVYYILRDPLVKQAVLDEVTRVYAESETAGADRELLSQLDLNK